MVLRPVQSQNYACANWAKTQVIMVTNATQLFFAEAKTTVRVFFLLPNIIMFFRALFVAIAGILTCVQRRSRGPRRRPWRKLWRRSRRNSRSILRPQTMRPPRTQSSGEISATTRPENTNSLPHSSGNEQDQLLSCDIERPERNEQTTDTTITSTAGGGISEKDGSLKNITSDLSEKLPELESWCLSLKVSDYFVETPESRYNADIPSSSKPSAKNEFSPTTTSHQIQDSGFANTSQKSIASCSGKRDEDCSQTSETASEVECWCLSLNISDYIPETPDHDSLPEADIPSSFQSSAFSLNTDIEEVGFVRDKSHDSIVSCCRVEDNDCSQTGETASEVECWCLSLNIGDHIPETPDSPPEADMPSFSKFSTENEFSPNTDIEEVGFVRDKSQESIASCSRVEDNDCTQTCGTASEVECWRLSLNIGDYIPETPDSPPKADMPSFLKSSTENEFSLNSDIEEVGFVRDTSQESLVSCSRSRVEDNDCSQTCGTATEKKTLPFKEELDISHRLESTGVTLEGVELTQHGSAVIGTILVHNECYEKHVAVRHTANGWQTFQSTSAQWLETVDGGAVDRFQFHLEIPDGEFSMEFAISFNEKWDNNEGKNYSLSCKVFNF